jgi:hypothetical protein
MIFSFMRKTFDLLLNGGNMIFLLIFKQLKYKIILGTKNITPDN